MRHYFPLILVLHGLHFKAFTQNVGIGTTTPQGKLNIKGNAGASQLVIDANAAQSNLHPLIRLRNAAKVNLMHIHSDDTLNTFIGLQAGRVNAPYLPNSFNGISNTFIGSGTGYSNTSGYNNTATVANALFYNTTGVC